MNDIDELIAIISMLGNEASIDQILDAYCKKFHMIKDSHYSSTIITTLNKYPQRVKFDSNTDTWKLCVAKKINGYKNIAVSSLIC